MQKTGSLMLLFVIILAVVIPAPLNAAKAQGGADGWTSYQLNLRTGPGPDYDVIAVLPSQTGMIFEGRTEDMAWLLGRTQDGSQRGWVASLYLAYADGFAAFRLPVSNEVIPYNPVPAAAPNNDNGSASNVAPPPNLEGLPPSGLMPELESIPIVYGIGPRAREIYLRGQSLGNDRVVVTKVGECNSLSWAFLRPFNYGEYELGEYGYLQAAIDQAQFVDDSIATGAGFTSELVTNPMYGDPGRCASDMSPLQCEYERSRPSVAFIMLGMHDVHFLSTSQYEQAMRNIIELSIDYGVIPVLTTFPIWPDGTPNTQARFEFNMILVRLSQEYGVPLVNFWLAANSVEHSGVGVDHVHITERHDNWTSFSGEQYQWGMTMWNLVALQALDQLQREAMY